MYPYETVGFGSYTMTEYWVKPKPRKKHPIGFRAPEKKSDPR